MRRGAASMLIAFACAVAAVAAPRRARADDHACAADAQLDGPSSKRHTTHLGARDFVGKTRAQVVKAHGEPGCKSPRLWRYWLPEGCAYEKDVVTLRWGGDGKVARVTIVHIFTGEECMEAQ